MSVTIRAHEPAAPDEWDTAWTASPYATFFHSRNWYELFARYNSRQHPQPLRITFSDGAQVILPLSVQQAGRLRFWQRRKLHLSSPAGTFGGWIPAAALRPEHAAVLATYLLEQPGLRWRINPYDPLAAEVRELLGSAVYDEMTQVLDLKAGFESILKGWTKGHRAAARQAFRSGVQVREAQSAADWRAYYTTYEDSMRRWGEQTTARYRWELFALLSAVGGDKVRLWLAESEGRVVAGALCLYAARHVCYWHGAALEDALPLRPVHAILHEAIRHAAGAGYHWFDFNPSGMLEGVRKFKKSFGCMELPAPMVQK